MNPFFYFPNYFAHFCCCCWPTLLSSYFAGSLKNEAARVAEPSVVAMMSKGWMKPYQMGTGLWFILGFIIFLNKNCTKSHKTFTGSINFSRVHSSNMRHDHSGIVVTFRKNKIKLKSSNTFPYNVHNSGSEWCFNNFHQGIPITHILWDRSKYLINLARAVLIVLVLRRLEQDWSLTGDWGRETTEEMETTHHTPTPPPGHPTQPPTTYEVSSHSYSGLQGIYSFLFRLSELILTDGEYSSSNIQSYCF